MTIKTPPRLTVVPKLRRDRNTLAMYPRGTATFAGWLLHFGANRLCRGGNEVRISPKATAVMSCLLASPNQVIARDALIDTVWADSDVGEEVLTQVIAELRRALGGTNGNGQLIETVRKSGYMLRAEVVPHDGELPRPHSDDASREDAARGEVQEPAPQIDVAIPRQVLASAQPAFPRALVLAAAIVCGLGSFVWWRQQVPVPVEAPAAAAATAASPAWSEPAPVTWEPGAEVGAAISPDGEFVVYRATDEVGGAKAGVLRLRRVGDAGIRDLARDETYSRVLAPVWSSDGAQIVFARVKGDSCSFRSVAVIGGDERTLADCQVVEDGTPPFDLSLDGRYAIQALPPKANGDVPTARITRTDLQSGARLALPYDIPDGSAAAPRYSPDGRRIAFLINLPSDIEAYVMPAEGGAVQRLDSSAARRIRSLAWMPDSRQLVLQRVDALHLLDLETGAETALGLTGAARPVVARQRERIVYVWQPPPNSNLLDVPLMTASSDAPTLPASRQLFVANAFTHQPRFSHRGDQIAFVSDRSGSFQVWIAGSDRDAARQLTELAPGARIADTVFTGDDTGLLVAYEDVDGHGFVVRVPTMGGKAVVEFSEPAGVTAMTLSSDDSDLYVASERHGAPLLRVARNTGDVRELPVRNVIHVRDPGDGYLYYDARDHLRIIRRRHSDGQIEMLPGIERASVLADFDVNRSGVIYIGKNEAKEDVVRLHELGAAQSVELAAIPESLAVQDLAVNADASRLLLVARVPMESDLYYADRLPENSQKR